MKKRERVSALLMALLMCMSLLPVGALADDEPGEAGEAVDVGGPAAEEGPSGPEEPDTAEETVEAEGAVEPEVSAEAEGAVAPEASAEAEEPVGTEVPAETEEPVETEEPAEAVTVEETIDLSGMDWPDSGEMFAAYAERVLYGETARLGGSSLDGYARLIGEDFDGIQLEVYRKMKAFVQSVASGGTVSTILEVIPENDTSGFDTEAFRSVFRALLSDCPYDLYWLNKTAGVSRTTTTSAGEVTKYTFRFRVSEDYGDASASEPAYTVDLSKIKAASTAAANAKAIVAQGKGKSAYDRMAFYCQKICDLASYNYEAAQSATMPYGDPWQLIYVFDGEETTRVVCEGYSKAFQYLCDLTEFDENEIITCITVTGRTSGGHMWNIVTMDDARHYLVDVTNCDSLGENAIFLRGSAGGSVSAGYPITASGQTITYVYDDSTLTTFPAAELELAAADYGTAQRISLAGAEVTVADAGLVYTGAPQEPDVTVRLDGEVLEAGTDYLIQYSGNTNAGSGYVQITGIGDYSGKTGVSFPIERKPLTGAAVTVSDQTYTGKALKPRVTVTLDGKTLTEGTDYTLVYANNTKIGKATVTAAGQGNYSGPASGKFSIWAASPVISELSLMATGVTITWGAVTGAEQYRVLRRAAGETVWTALADTAGTSYKDILPDAGVTYTYAVRCLSADGTKYTSRDDASGRTIAYTNVLPASAGWHKYDGCWYYVGSSGKPVLSRWLKSGGYWYYLKADGVMAANEALTIGGAGYIFKSGGAMATGWVKHGGSWYYCSASGAVKKSAWLKSGGYWYYLKADGVMAANEALTIGSTGYIFKSGGAMATGWVKYGGSWYYCSASGAVKKSVWVKSGGYWYYLKADGVMAANETLTIGGTPYQFNSSGRWVG